MDVQTSAPEPAEPRPKITVNYLANMRDEVEKKLACSKRRQFANILDEFLPNDDFMDAMRYTIGAIDWSKIRNAEGETVAYNGDLPKVIGVDECPKDLIVMATGNRSGKTTLATFQHMYNQHCSDMLVKELAALKLPEGKQIVGYDPDQSKEDQARHRAVQLEDAASLLMQEYTGCVSGVTRGKLEKQALHYRHRAETLRRTLDPDRDRGYRQNPEDKFEDPPYLQDFRAEIECLGRAIEIYRTENTALKKQNENQRLCIEGQSARLAVLDKGGVETVFRDRPSQIETLNKMESDIGRLRKFLGSEQFDAVVSGAPVKRHVPAEPRGKFDWNEMRRMR